MIYLKIMKHGIVSLCLYWHHFKLVEDIQISDTI